MPKIRKLQPPKLYDASKLSDLKRLIAEYENTGDRAIWFPDLLVFFLGAHTVDTLMNHPTMELKVHTNHPLASGVEARVVIRDGNTSREIITSAEDFTSAVFQSYLKLCLARERRV